MDMDKLVSLCKRRGFLFQSSEIYGGLNGFWDYGPLGVELKRNVKEAWWRDMVTGHDDLATLPGAPRPIEMVGLDCTIIMHPQVWKCSGHYDLFHDFMVDCRESKKRYRHDQVRRPLGRGQGQARLRRASRPTATKREQETEQRALKFFNLRAKNVEELHWDGPRRVADDGDGLRAGARARRQGARHADAAARVQPDVQDDRRRAGRRGGRGVPAARDGAGHLRQLQERASTARACKMPFGIAQVGKSFRNEITPRNFTFRSREFEQMEIEFFCHPKAVAGVVSVLARSPLSSGISTWAWPANGCGCASMSTEELSHYSCGTADIEYAFPFLPPGEFGELEGIAHRGDFDLRSHMEGKLVKQGRAAGRRDWSRTASRRHKGSGKDLTLLRRADAASSYIAARDRAVGRGRPRRRWRFCARRTARTRCPTRTASRGARRAEAASAAGADQGGDLPAGQQGRHAGDRAEALSRAEEASSTSSTTTRAPSAGAIAGRTKRARRTASPSTARRCRIRR